MSNLSLTNSEMEDINILINLGQSILETQKELAKLEANNEMHTPLYNSTLERMKSTLALENSIYTRLNLAPEKYIAVFLKLGNTTNFFDQIKSLLNSNESELAKNRLLNKLYFDLKDKTENSKSIRGIAINTSNGNQRFFNPKNIFKLEEALKTDILNSIITFLTIEINKCQNNEIRRLLTEMKYKLAYLNPNYEEMLINSEYEPGELYLTSQAYAELLHIDKDMHDNLMFQFTKSLFDITAANLSNSTEQDINANYINIIFYKVLLKTCLLLDTNDIENTLKKQLSFQLNIMGKRRNAGTNIVLEILEHAKDDKKIPKVISLKLKRESE